MGIIGNSCHISAKIHFADMSNLPPSGRRGLMLGEILGRKAGLTRLDVTLFLFLEFRADLASPFLLNNAGLVGDEPALSIGLGFPVCAIVPDGVLSGPSLGVFLATSRGVS